MHLTLTDQETRLTSQLLLPEQLPLAEAATSTSISEKFETPAYEVKIMVQCKLIEGHVCMLIAAVACALVRDYL